MRIHQAIVPVAALLSALAAIPAQAGNQLQGVDPNGRMAQGENLNGENLNSSHREALRTQADSRALRGIALREVKVTLR